MSRDDFLSGAVQENIFCTRVWNFWAESRALDRILSLCPALVRPPPSMTRTCRSANICVCTDDHKHHCLYFPLSEFLFHEAFTWYLHFIRLSSYLQKWSSNNARAGGKAVISFFFPRRSQQRCSFAGKCVVLKECSVLVCDSRFGLEAGAPQLWGKADMGLLNLGRACNLFSSQRGLTKEGEQLFTRILKIGNGLKLRREIWINY